MKPRSLLWLVTILSLLPFVIIFLNPNLPHTSDGGVQIPRMAAFFTALRDGHLPVRWAGDLNYGYGLPLFNFIYHLPFWISSLFIALGLPLVLTFKLVLTLSFLGSGIFTWVWAREFFDDEQKAFWVTMFYQFAPFRLVEILVRGSIGGIYAYTFLPLVFWGLARIRKKPTFKNSSLVAVATALLILSHNSLSLIFFGLAILWIFITSPNRKIFTLSLVGLTIGLGLAAYFWLPALIEHKYTYGDLFMSGLYLKHFPPLVNFFLPNPFNLEAFRTAEISVQWGALHILGLGTAIFLLWKKRLSGTLAKITWIAIIITLGALFFMQPISRPFWDHISWLRQFQFPWRLLALISITTTLTALSLLELKLFRRPLVYWSSIVLLVGSTAFFWYPRQGFDQINEQDFWNYPLNTTYFGETDVIWSAGPAKEYPKNRIELVSGQAQITDFQKKTQIHTFQVLADTPIELVDHTQYFPGWRVYIDAAKVPIEFQNPNHRGLIKFSVPQGAHAVSVVFAESPIRLLSNLISIISLIVTAIFFVYSGKRQFIK